MPGRTTLLLIPGRDVIFHIHNAPKTSHLTGCRRCNSVRSGRVWQIALRAAAFCLSLAACANDLCHFAGKSQKPLIRALTSAAFAFLASLQVFFHLAYLWKTSRDAETQGLHGILSSGRCDDTNECPVGGSVKVREQVLHLDLTDCAAWQLRLRYGCPCSAGKSFVQGAMRTSFSIARAWRSRNLAEAEVCALQARHIQASPHSRVTPPPPLGPDARLVHGTALRSTARDQHATVQATAARRTAREAARSEKSKRMGLLRVAAMPRAKRKLCVVNSLQRAGLVPRGHRRQCPKKASAAGPPVASTENPGKNVSKPKNPGVGQRQLACCVSDEPLDFWTIRGVPGRFSLRLCSAMVEEVKELLLVDFRCRQPPVLQVARLRALSHAQRGMSTSFGSDGRWYASTIRIT